MTAARQRLACATLAAIQGTACAADWTQFARAPARIAHAQHTPSLAQPDWVLSTDAASRPIAFVGQAGIVAASGRIFAPARIGGQHMLVAATDSGDFLWAALLPPQYLDSWSTPAVDAGNGAVIVGARDRVIALDAATGVQRWQATLQRNIVNASPLVTSDLGSANRAFITDYDPFGGAGRLYCINIDPFDAAANPFAPGDIVWSVSIGASSGNTPAYHDGVVYVTTVSDSSGQLPGRILAFSAGANGAPEPLWVFTNPALHGFFGGVAVRVDAGSAHLFAATYAHFGGQFAANLVKVDANTGALTWSVPSNRTDATPIPLPDGRIVLSGGIHGFGSAPSIQLFHDHGGSATLVWDSAIDSWIDLNENGLMDPGEYLALGGWTHQPIAITAAPPRLITGAIAPQSFAACTDLYIIDLDRHPAEPQFITAHFSGAGSTPAVSGVRLYTIGASGLHAFPAQPPACYANCDGSSIAPLLNIDDFTCFINRFAEALPLPHHQQVTHYANCDGSTVAPALNIDDFSCFINRFAAGCR